MYFRSEQQKKNTFFFCCSLAYSYLWTTSECTFARDSKRKTCFSFAVRSLIRTFAHTTDNQYKQEQYAKTDDVGGHDDGALLGGIGC
jgi:hypothetical protein